MGGVDKPYHKRGRSGRGEEFTKQLSNILGIFAGFSIGVTARSLFVSPLSLLLPGPLLLLLALLTTLTLMLTLALTLTLTLS